MGIVVAIGREQFFCAHEAQGIPGVGRHDILAALAATSARDDGGAAIASHLRATSIDGITCASWAECTTVLKTDSDIDYGGVSGPLDLTSNGDLTSAYYGIYRYAAGNTYSRVSTVLVGPGR